MDLKVIQLGIILTIKGLAKDYLKMMSLKYALLARKIYIKMNCPGCNHEWKENFSYWATYSDITDKVVILCYTCRKVFTNKDLNKETLSEILATKV